MELSEDKSSIILTSSKQYILRSPSDDLENWYGALMYASRKALEFNEVKANVNPWISKRGGQDHQFKNWKKRYAVLRGNLLLYYSDEPLALDIMHNLEGYIDLSNGVFIDETQGENVGKDHYLKLTVNYEKEYYISTSSHNQKIMWCNYLIDHIASLRTLYNLPDYREYEREEPVLKKGYLSRISAKGESKKVYTVVTPYNIRFYENKKKYQYPSHGVNLLSSISVLGLSAYSLPNRIVLFDQLGNELILQDEEGEGNDVWKTTIENAVKKLVEKYLLMKLKITLKLDVLRGENSLSGLTYFITSIDHLEIVCMPTDHDIYIEYSDIKEVTLFEQTVTIKYKERSTKTKRELAIRCREFQALYVTLSHSIEFSKSSKGKKKSKKNKE